MNHPPLVLIDFYEGEYLGSLSGLALLCSLEGRVTVYDRPPLDLIEELEKLLELCGERWSAPSVEVGPSTTFVRDNEQSDSAPLLRVDADTSEGLARAKLSLKDGTTYSIPAITVGRDDDVAAVLRKLLKSMLH